MSREEHTKVSDFGSVAAGFTSSRNVTNSLHHSQDNHLTHLQNISLSYMNCRHWIPGVLERKTSFENDDTIINNRGTLYGTLIMCLVGLLLPLYHWTPTEKGQTCTIIRFIWLRKVSDHTKLHHCHIQKALDCNWILQLPALSLIETKPEEANYNGSEIP